MNRYGFVIWRLIQTIPTVIGVTILVFFMIHLVPGDPARALLGPRATPALVAKLHHAWGLDRPLWTQYLLFMDRLVHGNLGSSFFYDAPATQLIAGRLPATLLLLLMATLFTGMLTIPVALFAAAHRGKAADVIVRSIPIVGLGMPPFWVGIMLILFLALGLRAFPVGGYGNTLPQHLWSLVLPALTIALAIAPMTIRSLRASLLQVLESDYVTTARAKGIPAWRVLSRHALRNAIMPMITVLSVNIGWLVGGTVVIEQVFALPGVGGLMIDAISNRDFALVQGVTLVFATLVILVNLLTDVAYAMVDPRVRFD